MNEKYASLYFSGKYQKVIDAEKVYRHFKDNVAALPQDRQPQYILCEALIALGQREGILESSTVTHEANVAYAIEVTYPVLQSIEELKTIITDQFSGLAARINRLAESGVITQDQATLIHEQISTETAEFAKHMKSSLRGGKR